MVKYYNSDIADLAHQLTLSPVRQRLKQIAGIEQLLSLVQPDQSYPYELVCFHVTGYRPRRSRPRPAVRGRELIADLVGMADHITRKAAVAVSALPGPCRSQEALAERLHVSPKTIRRWRRRGLLGVRAVDRDGTRRLVFCEPHIKRFVKQNAALVQRGASFRQLSDDEKQRMVERARLMLRERRLRLHVVARTIAAETGRAVETVRYTLRRYDRGHPDEALFSGQGFPHLSAQHRGMYKCHLAGESVRRIAATFDCDAAYVEQVLREIELRRLRDDPPQYIDNELFAAPGAEKLILEVPRPASEKPVSKVRPPKDLPAYLRSLYDEPLLTAAQEQDAFRRYNYLKYAAARRIADGDPCATTAAELNEIHDLLRRAEELKQELIRANLRLVVSIAKKHVGWSPKFFEVISDGNMSLMRAVEKFDYARGFKFSTYASWAIMKNYARTIPEQQYRVRRYVTGQEELLAAAPDHRAPEPDRGHLEDVRRVLTDGLRQLTERERTVVTGHFGLFSRGPGQTLEQLGDSLGVTKERVRQIEKRAIAKLRGTLSPAVADLLPD